MKYLICLQYTINDNFRCDLNNHSYILFENILLKVPPKKPAIEALTEQMWFTINYLEDSDSSFAGLAADCLKKIPIKLGTFSLVIWRIIVYLAFKI